MADDVGKSSRTGTTPRQDRIIPKHTIKRLHFILGPTASGKTARAIALAQHLNTEIISCDSRQFYQELNIGVARPTVEELAAARHHFIACRSVSEPYNVYTFEQDALRCLERLFEQYDTIVAVGGSGLYVEALRHGIAFLPDPTPELRAELHQKLQEEGVSSLRAMLRRLDPDYYDQVDLANGIRLQRALEVTITTGIPYSKYIQQTPRQRPFETTTEVVQRQRDELRQRIDARVTAMMEQGLEAEARSVYKWRRLNTLNTVGYKEFFALWDAAGTTFPLSDTQRETVAAAIRLNTWHYAKKQLTWLKKRG